MGSTAMDKKKDASSSSSSSSRKSSSHKKLMLRVHIPVYEAEGFGLKKPRKRHTYKSTGSKINDIDQYLFLPGLIEKHSDYAKVCFKWKEEDGKLFSSRNTIADSIAGK
ncbi:hypothetical protein TURU_162025 [Turdus rufiventris]|nr:hypothetical protein TURU_162025 [Turdus rufiventris]